MSSFNIQHGKIHPLFKTFSEQNTAATSIVELCVNGLIRPTYIMFSKLLDNLAHFRTKNASQSAANRQCLNHVFHEAQHKLILKKLSSC